MIQTETRNDRGEVEQLDHNDIRYWNGPYRYEPFPKAMYRQTQPGQEPDHRIVKSDSEMRALGSDWKESPVEAKAAFEALEADMAAAAAEYNAANLRMSDKAQREALAYDRSTDEMVADVPAPKRGPGRPKREPDAQ